MDTRRVAMPAILLLAALTVAGCSAPAGTAAAPSASVTEDADASEREELEAVLADAQDRWGLDLRALADQATAEPTTVSSDVDGLLLEYPTNGLTSDAFTTWVAEQSLPTDWIDYVPSAVDESTSSDEVTGKVAPDESAGIVFDPAAGSAGYERVSLLVWFD